MYPNLSFCFVRVGQTGQSKLDSFSSLEAAKAAYRTKFYDKVRSSLCSHGISCCFKLRATYCFVVSRGGGGGGGGGQESYSYELG